ncbi:hypothetical protein Tco_0769687 [Tanacetum coccineum]|uniref:Reverse transcriptase domain-containing protein n=1 Tax=Tanacetum coccineum TaxID=301880 RepID=A0ABQ4ZBB8_9ASTR
MSKIHTRYAVLDHPNTPYPSHLDNHYCEEEEGNYRPKFTKAYEASHIKNTIPRKEKDPGSFTLPCFINDVCFDNALVDFGASVSVMPLSTYLNLGLGELAHTRLTVELADRIVKYPKGIAENVLVGIGKFTFSVDFIIIDMPEDIKVPLILGRPFLSTARTKINVYKRKITLRVGEEKIIFKSVKPTGSIIKRVYMLCLRARIELDLEARLMRENLVLNRSLDHFLEDYIELNDLNEPFELRRNQGDDLMPTIKEATTSNLPKMTVGDAFCAWIGVLLASSGLVLLYRRSRTSGIVWPYHSRANEQLLRNVFCFQVVMDEFVWGLIKNYRSIVTSAALEKATSASAQLEEELSRRSETASAYLVDNFVSTKMKQFLLEGVLLKLEYALKVRVIRLWRQSMYYIFY